MDPHYPLPPIISLLCGLLALIPLPWLFVHWNTGAWMYAIWVSLACIFHGINAIIWKDNTVNIAPIWCDITSRFYIGESVAIPAASLAITRRIYLLFSLKRQLTPTPEQKRNAVLFDLGLTLGLPILQMIAYYVVQGHRFNILEEFGCAPTNVNTWYAFLVLYSWPLVTGLISCVYCALIVRIYLQRRRTLRKLDSTAHFGRYHRALAMGCADAVFTVPCAIIVIVVDGALVDPVNSMGWADVHFNFSRVGQFPATVWKNSPVRWEVFAVYWNFWVSPGCAIVFFCFFGTTKEVWSGYARAFITVFRKLGLDRHFRRRTDKQHPDTALNVSEFRVASLTNQGGNHNPVLTSTVTVSMIEIAGLSDALNERQTSYDSETDLENKIPPLEKDPPKNVERCLPATEDV